MPHEERSDAHSRLKALLRALRDEERRLEHAAAGLLDHQHLAVLRARIAVVEARMAGLRQTGRPP
jgi:hypothetical protein